VDRQVVYVVCAEDEEELAGNLAEPLKEAGYEVAHNGTIAIGGSRIGEAEKAVASGAPIVLCATARAIGSAWAHRIVNAAHSGGVVRVFVIQMERQAYVEQLALDGKIARYCDDPAQAIKDLIQALAKNYPPNMPSVRPEGEASSNVSIQFLDQPTDAATFDVHELEEFRRNLRKEVAARYPSNLTPWEFLSRAGLWVEGRLTRAGALLFAKNATAVCPTSMVKCAWYRGMDRAATLRDMETFEGTVPAQIFGALEFVADRVRLGEAPVAGQAQSADIYEYPMIAVREVIANALVHRDYASMDSCVHVRLFTDRLEVSSPGSWLGQNLEPGVQYPLSSLSGHSIKRNFRLAHDLSWIKLVEGEGAGIPWAIRDCEAMHGPQPAVAYDNGFVTVTIHRQQPLDEPKIDSGQSVDAPGRLPSHQLSSDDSGGPSRRLSRTEASGRIGMWGAVGSGKTTFLAALYIAANRSSGQDLNIFGVDDTSTELMVESNRMLTNQHQFPSATGQVGSYSWVMNMTSMVNQPRRTWFGRQIAVPVTTQVSIDLRDAPGGFFASEPMALAGSRLDLGDETPEAGPDPTDMVDYLADCDGLLLLIDPVRERRLGDAHEYFQGTLLRMAQRRMARMSAGAKLPHYVAVCITKFDDPEVYRFARLNGFRTYDENDEFLFPRVHSDDAQSFFRQLCDTDDSDADLICNGLMRYFQPERIRYFVTSAIGFYARGGRFREDDHSNVIEDADGSVKIRGHIHPINVLEPILWLGQSLVSEKRRVIS
jgi:Putative ATP-dependent DNA helicase recG C-terminal